MTLIRVLAEFCSAMALVSSSLDTTFAIRDWRTGWLMDMSSPSRKLKSRAWYSFTSPRLTPREKAKAVMTRKSWVKMNNAFLSSLSTATPASGPTSRTGSALIPSTVATQKGDESVTSATSSARVTCWTQLAVPLNKFAVHR